MLKKIEKPNDPQENLIADTDKNYLRAMPLQDAKDVELIKKEVQSGNILIIRVVPLAEKNVEDVKRVVNELRAFIELEGGDIARLGEERIVITPPHVRIWRGT